MSYVDLPAEGALIPSFFSPFQNLKRPENLYHIWWYFHTISTCIHGKRGKKRRENSSKLCFIALKEIQIRGISSSIQLKNLGLCFCVIFLVKEKKKQLMNVNSQATFNFEFLASFATFYLFFLWGVG